MTANQTQGIGHQRSPTYVHCSTSCPNFSSISLYDHQFSRCWTFYDFPIDSHVKNFKVSQKNFNFWQIVKNVIAYISPLYDTVYEIWLKSDGNWSPKSKLILAPNYDACMKCGWNLMKTVGGVAFQKSENRLICKVHRMTPNQTQWIGHQRSLTYMYVQCSTPCTKFSSIPLYHQPFWRYSTF